MNKTGMNRIVSPLMVLMMVFGSLALVGCQKTSPPRRVPPGETTDAELNDRRQLPVSLVEFQEAAANDLLQQLPDVRGIADSPDRVTILLGDINNKTSLVSTADYEFVVSGIRSRLIRARATRDKLKFVEKRRRVENLAAQARVPPPPAPPAAGSEEIRWGGGSYYVPDYQADETFGLLMDVYRIGRGNTNLYRIEVMLVSFATNEIVYSYEQQMKQVGR